MHRFPLVAGLAIIGAALAGSAGALLIGLGVFDPPSFLGVAALGAAVGALLGLRQG